MSNQTEITPEQEVNKFQESIECFEVIAKKYGQTVNIRQVGTPDKGYSKLHAGRWIIEVMGRKFRNESFVEAAKEAVKFVYYAHQNQPVSEQQS